MAIVIVSLMYAFTNLNFDNFKKSISSFDVWFYLVVFIVFLPIFIIFEKKSKDPIIRLKYFSHRNPALTMSIGFLVGCGIMGLIFIPQFSENMLKLQPGQGGYVVTIVAIFAGIAGPIGGKIIDKFSSKALLIVGFIVSIATMLVISYIVIPTLNKALLYICCATMGLGLGFTMGTPLNYLIQLFAPQNESGTAQSTLSLVKSVGIAISPNLLIGFISKASEKVGPALIKVMPPMPVKTFSSKVLESAQENVSAEAAALFEHANVTNIVTIVKEYADMLIKEVIKVPGNESFIVSEIQEKYNDAILASASKIQDTFQATINQGYANLFVGMSVFSLLALILTFFLSGKEIKEKKKELEQTQKDNTVLQASDINKN